ncbi:MAG: serpin family protein [Acidimicrobiia bacterium]
MNAITFDGSWMNQFDPSDTRPGDFTRTDGSVVEADMMHGSGFDVPYLIGDGFEAVWLPYWGGASMAIVLPDSTPAEWLAETETISLLEMRQSAYDQPFTDLALPRFEFTSRTMLGKTLIDLGMPSAFDSVLADLTGMSEPGGPDRLALAEVIHQAMVRVDEVGTKAAAATAVVATTESGEPEPRTLIIDCPFVFFIVDDMTAAPIFSGIVEDPTVG